MSSNLSSFKAMRRLASLCAFFVVSLGLVCFVSRLFCWSYAILQPTEGEERMKPFSDLDPSLREQVNGLMRQRVFPLHLRLSLIAR